MFAKVSSLGLFGLNAFPVDVEIDISRGNPMFEIVGLPDTVVKESRERIRAALRSCSISFPVASVMINLAPADTKKSGSVPDMAIFMAVLRGMRMITEETDGCAYFAEYELPYDTYPEPLEDEFSLEAALFPVGDYDLIITVNEQVVGAMKLSVAPVWD